MNHIGTWRLSKSRIHILSENNTYIDNKIKGKFKTFDFENENAKIKEKQL